MGKTQVLSIGTAVPAFRSSQAQTASFLKEVARHSLAGSADPATLDTDIRRACVMIDHISHRSAIHHRHSVLSDYLGGPEEFRFFPRNWSLSPFPSTGQRMQVYQREALPLARSAAERCLEQAKAVAREAITHLVVVSCTGFFAPGLDVLLVRALGLRGDVQRQIIGFMGCYAAFNALRAADSICQAQPDAVVLVVCVELCSLHYQREMNMDNIVANTLFADGAAAVLLSGRAGAQGCLSLIDSESQLAADDSQQQMTWTVTDTGFQMALSSEIPESLRRCVGSFVDTLLQRNQITRAAVDFWAIHPGGRRIVDGLRAELALSSEDTAASCEVLAEHGNMSSATVLFVLERCLRQGPPRGALGVAMAFGPGLTLESMLFRVEGAGRSAQVARAAPTREERCPAPTM